MLWEIVFIVLCILVFCIVNKEYILIHVELKWCWRCEVRK